MFGLLKTIIAFFLPSLPMRKHTTCGICGDEFRMTHDPLSASKTRVPWSFLPFGLRLPCPSVHQYCLACLSTYLRFKLDPDGHGKGLTDTIVFPIRCPECPAGQWDIGIGDGVAERVLEGKELLMWVSKNHPQSLYCPHQSLLSFQHNQKRLDSVPRHYCPNPPCSALVPTDGDTSNPNAECPECNTHMCISCQTYWHEGRRFLVSFCRVERKKS